jgi:hypothetical protein
MGQHEPNETLDTAFFLGTLAFPGTAPDGGVSTNFFRFDDARTWWGSDGGTDDPSGGGGTDLGGDAGGRHAVMRAPVRTRP